MNVLLAVDESEGSVRVARAARQMFGDDANYLVVNVGQPPAETLRRGSARSPTVRTST